MAIQQVAYNTSLVREAIELYDKLYPTGPDSIYACMVEARAEQAELERLHIVSKSGIVNQNQAGRRQHYTMPSTLYVMLKKKFPTIFKEDIKKFERDFPVFFKSWKQ